MPTFRAKPYVLTAHHVRYEDAHGLSTDQPEWLQAAIEEGRVVPSSAPEGMEILTPAGRAGFARMGEWILCSPDESLRAVSKETLALEYELVS